ncbi:MAG: DUF2075 domain-containing protein [Accumulibacter sp.]
MANIFYKDSISNFLITSEAEIIGKLAINSQFADELNQKNAWKEEISILQKSLQNLHGEIYFEFSIPRMGQRIDVVLLINSIVFVLEFKIGEKEFQKSGIDQVWDYALDLKNFHESSHDKTIIPIIIATAAKVHSAYIISSASADQVYEPIRCNTILLAEIIKKIIDVEAQPLLVEEDWAIGRYCPTPTIIEAAMALYSGHSVTEISRSDASAINLSQTSETISSIIVNAREKHLKIICLVTGVPGAGKTLVGLNIATKFIDKSTDLHSVFLSGNGPLVNILREALARDKVSRDRSLGIKTKKTDALREVKLFIQNVHHFRDDCLERPENPPIEHIALFDEAQRAWNIRQTSNFMRQKKGKPDFNKSEPDFLISCLDRHHDWAVIVCLVGGGQEINTGEAGISEWLDALKTNYHDWHIYISSRLIDNEYGAGRILENIRARRNVYYNENLHLSVSMRSFRAENVSLLVKQILDLEVSNARETLNKLRSKYPIIITRDLNKAKKWLKGKSRGSERYGIVVSSQAERLKPHAIDVKSPMDPIHWFLDGKEDVRSSYYLEDVATEFDIQGLELDWVCITWDADFRHTPNGWDYRSFVGDKWNHIKKAERQFYLKNAYRVLLTRARQGMVIVVPEGDEEDPTRTPIFYDPIYAYLKSIGFDELN